MAVRLKRRRVVTDPAGAQRVLIDDTPTPDGWTEVQHGQPVVEVEPGGTAVTQTNPPEPAPTVGDSAVRVGEDPKPHGRRPAK